MSVLAGMWQSFRHAFFPASRKSRLPRALPDPDPPVLRLIGLLRLWASWVRRRAWLHCDHPPLHAERPPVLSGVVELQGWAVSLDGIASVTVSCDGSLFGAAALGVRRPGLGRRFPHVRRAKGSAFFLLLDTRALADGDHELTVTARTRAGQTVRVSGPLRVCNVISAYERWRQLTTPNAAALAWIRRNVPHLPFRPVVSLLVPVQTPRELAGLPRTLDSVRAQAYPHWQLVIVCSGRLRAEAARLAGRHPDGRVRVSADPRNGDPRNAALRQAGGGLFAPLDAGDRLEPEALFELVYCFNRTPDADLVYSDEEVGGRPVFKPDWSPRLLLGVNYVGRLWAARRELLGDEEAYAAAFGSAAEHELLLRLTERARAVGHVPAVLVRRPQADVVAAEATHNAVRAALGRRGVEAEPSAGPAAGTVRVRRPCPEGSLVTILIEGPDAEARGLLDSLTPRTSYRDYELRLTGGTGPGLAERLNKAADAARGEYLLFVRAAGVVSEGWVEALLEHAAGPDGGVAGGHLEDAAGRTVDGGLALVEDDRFMMPLAQAPGGEEPGTLPLLSASRECAAVSRDCLMVRRELFLELGGFDERLDGRLIEADFCLHARARGVPVVSTPSARLRAAAEGVAPPSAAAAEVFRARWPAEHGRGDPYFSPNFSRRRDGLRVNEEPTVFNHAPSPLIDRESVRRVLAVKPDHIGDVQLALPAVRRLRELFPEAELTMLVGPHTRSLAEREPAVDRVLTYEYFFADSHKPPKRLTAGERARLRTWLGAYGFDLAVDLRRETDSRQLVRLSGARWTAGFSSPGEAEWLTVTLSCEGPIRLLKPQRHMSQDLLRLVDMVARAMTDSPAVSAPPPPDEDAAVARLFDEVVPRGHRLLVGIHPGSGRPIKCWPAAHFARLAGMFAERLGAAVVLFGGPDDVKLAGEVMRLAPAGTPVVSLAGRFGLGALATAARRCDLFVGNDSGPTHLAAATGVPVLGVYAGTADPTQWGPLGPGAAALQRGLLCTPCYVSRPRDCPLGVVCTKYLHPEPVFEAAVRLLLPRWSKLAAGHPAGAAAAGARQTDFAERVRPEP